MIIAVLTERQWFSVEEPFDFHVRIPDGSQLAFELGGLHFDQIGLVLDLSNESAKKEHG